MSDKNAEASKPEGSPAAAGGFKALLPLLLNIVLMPVIAYVMTVFVLLPKMNSGGLTAHAKSPEAEAGGAEHSSGGKSGGGKISVPLSTKVLVNVSGTAGTRYLLASLTLVGTSADLKESIDKSDAQLRDVASSVLATKTIADLDKPGSRNLIRTELISAFNGVLGESRVKEIYFTEFAIQ
jgi:flagellar FliL protein